MDSKESNAEDWRSGCSSKVVPEFQKPLYCNFWHFEKLANNISSSENQDGLGSMK